MWPEPTLADYINLTITGTSPLPTALEIDAAVQADMEASVMGALRGPMVPYSDNGLLPMGAINLTPTPVAHTRGPSKGMPNPRRLPGIRFRATLPGSINIVTVNGVVEF